MAQVMTRGIVKSKIDYLYILGYKDKWVIRSQAPN